MLSTATPNARYPFRARNNQRTIETAVEAQRSSHKAILNLAQLLFFHQGEYIGIDSGYPQQVISIEDRGTRLIVTYKDWEALEQAGVSNAEAPSYTLS